MIVSPVYWHQAPAALKLMIDRLVCADGGNPDPTRTDGKNAKKAKAIELEGWDYPRHLKGRAFALVVHGDTVGAETLRRSLHDWLCDMQLVPAGVGASIDRYIGYYEPYATSHAALDKDEAVQQEVRNAAQSLLTTVTRLRAGELREDGLLLEAMRLCGCSRIVAAGSFFENFCGEPRALNLYAATKRAFEDILAYYTDACGMAATTLVLYEVYSECDTRLKFMNVLADAWCTGATVRLPTEEFWLDLVHVEDVAAAFLHAANLLEDKGAAGKPQRYCVCSGRDIGATELLARFERIGRRKLVVERGYPQPERNMPRPWRGAALPGWSPRVPIDEGIARMLACRAR